MTMTSGPSGAKWYVGSEETIGVAGMDRRTMRRAVLGFFGLMLAIFLLVSAGIVWMADQPNGRAGIFTVVFPPGTSMTERFLRIHAAGGAVVRGGTLPGFAVGHSDRPGFAGRLRAQGAWLVLTPGAFQFSALGGCFPTEIFDPKNNPRVPAIR
jgi:hypothetical protein